MNNTDDSSRVRRRDRFRSLAQSTTFAIKQEINKYYVSPTATPTKARSIMSTNSNEPLSTEMKRSDTQEIDDILQESIPELIQPQCMLFPTYACQVNDEEEEGQIQWKVVLAGWAFAKPGSSRLDRWLLGKYYL